MGQPLQQIFAFQAPAKLQAEVATNLLRALLGKSARLAAVRDAPDVGPVAHDRCVDLVILCDAAIGRLTKAVENCEYPDNVLVDAMAALRL